jgi:hypothetical protein
MGTWTAGQLKAITDNDDLFVSPFREDGTTYGTPSQTWALVVDGNVYVRAANDRSRADTRPRSAKRRVGYASPASTTMTIQAFGAGDGASRRVGAM